MRNQNFETHQPVSVKTVLLKSFFQVSLGLLIFVTVGCNETGSSGSGASTSGTPGSSSVTNPPVVTVTPPPVTPGPVGGTTPDNNAINALISSQVTVAQTAVTAKTTLPINGNANLYVQNAANYSNVVSPGSYAAIYGTALQAITSEGASPQPLTTLFKGVDVWVGSQIALISYVSATQLNIVVPKTLKPGTYSLAVIQNQQQLGPQVPITISASSPAIFTADQSGVGSGIIQAYDGGRYDLAYNPLSPFTPVAVEPVFNGSPNVIVLWGTGGLCSTVSFDGVEVQASYAAPQSNFAGLEQVNVTIPQSQVQAATHIANVSLHCGSNISNWVRLCIAGTSGSKICPAPTAAKILQVNGTGQIAPSQFPFGDMMAVRIIDSVGQPISGLTVNWNDPKGIVQPAANVTTTVTDSSGFTSVSARAISSGFAGMADQSQLFASLTAKGGQVLRSGFWGTSIASQSGTGIWVPGFLVQDVIGTNAPVPIEATAGQLLKGQFRLLISYGIGSNSGQPIPNAGIHFWVAPNDDGTPAPTAYCANGVDEVGTVLSDSTGVATCDLQIGPTKGTGTLYYSTFGSFTNHMSITVK